MPWPPGLSVDDRLYLPNTSKFAVPLVVGYFINWGLLGTLTTQIHQYYVAFPKDRISVKVMVYGVFLVELIQTGFITHDAIRRFALGFGDQYELTRMNFAWLTIPVFSGAVSYLVQLFYARRMWILTSSWFAVMIVIVLSSIQLAGAITLGVILSKNRDAMNLTSGSAGVVASSSVWNGGSALCDIFIAAYMTHYFWFSQNGMQGTQDILSRLIRSTIETGTVTAVVAILNLILIVTNPAGVYYFLATSSILGKLYSNTMLVSLNSRTKIIGGRYQRAPTTEVMMPPISFKTVRMSSDSRQSRSTHDTLIEDDDDELRAEVTSGRDLTEEQLVERVPMISKRNSFA